MQLRQPYSTVEVLRRTVGCAKIVSKSTSSVTFATFTRQASILGRVWVGYNWQDDITGVTVHAKVNLHSKYGVRTGIRTPSQAWLVSSILSVRCWECRAPVSIVNGGRERRGWASQQSTRVPSKARFSSSRESAARRAESPKCYRGCFSALRSCAGFFVEEQRRSVQVIQAIFDYF